MPSGWTLTDGMLQSRHQTEETLLFLPCSLDADTPGASRHFKFIERAMDPPFMNSWATGSSQPQRCSAVSRDTHRAPAQAAPPKHSWPSPQLLPRGVRVLVDEALEALKALVWSRPASQTSHFPHPLLINLEIKETTAFGSTYS